MAKKFTLCRLDQANISEWLDEADTRAEAEEKFETLKASLKAGEILVVADSASGRWMKKYPEEA